MIIKESFKKTVNITGVSGCLAFFTNEKFDFNDLKKNFKATDHSKIVKLLKFSSKRKNFLSFNLNSNQRLIFVGLKKRFSFK